MTCCKSSFRRDTLSMQVCVCSQHCRRLTGGSVVSASKKLLTQTLQYSCVQHASQNLICSPSGPETRCDFLSLKRSQTISNPIFVKWIESTFRRLF